MRVCAECGAGNEDGEDFCGQCGAYLEWDAEQAAQVPLEQKEPAEGPAATADSEERPRGLVDRVREAVGSRAAPRAEDAPAAADSAPPAASDANAGPAASDVREQDVVTGPPEPDVRRASPDHAATGPDASALVVKVPPPAPAGPQERAPRPRRPRPEPTTNRSDQPGAVRPGAAVPKPRRPPPTTVREPVDHGDLVCGACGAGNKPVRKFCRRCGRELVDAVVAKAPWWRRLLRRRRSLVAGSRPGRARLHRPSRTGLAVVVLVLLGLAVAAFSLRDSIVGVYDRVADRVIGSEPFHPAMSASSSARGASAARANDGKSNRFWAPASTTRVRGQYLDAEFDTPVRLLHLVVTPGVSTKEPEFLASGRPTALRLSVVDGSGEVRRELLELPDTAGGRTFDVVYDDVRRVRLSIVDFEQGSRQATRVGIAEVEFYGRD